MEAKLVQPLNAPQSITVTLLGISTEIRLVQASKVPCILVTPFGILTCVKLAQFVKISSRPVILFEISTDVSSVQSVKALLPISVTLLGILTEAKFPHP